MTPQVRREEMDPGNGTGRTETRWDETGVAGTAEAILSLQATIVTEPVNFSHL